MRQEGWASWVITENYSCSKHLGTAKGNESCCSYVEECLGPCTDGFLFFMLL